MWTLQYTISQICVVIALICLGITYLIKNKTIILILAIFSSSFYGIQYLLLGGYMAVGLAAIGILRGIWFFINDNKRKKNDPYSIIIISLLVVLFGVISYSHVVDILIIFTGLLFTYAIWQSNNAFYRWSSLLVSVCWISYNAFYNSIFGIISESVLLLVEIVGVILLYVKNNCNDKINNKSI